ncbi:hypothetical protein MMC13_008315 [Lambiella insularis]|nr:hypothetical protein [Lambiella insularis]
MPVAHRPKPERSPASGNDILSRMLQLEKLNQQHRPPAPDGSTLPRLKVTPNSPRHGAMPNSSTRSTPSVQQSVPSPSVPLIRAPTSVDLIAEIAAKQEPSLASMEKRAADTVTIPPDSAPEICKSPSWAEYNGDKGMKEKKRVEKEGKELDKKQQRDVEKYRITELKAAKRLSKKPPAAMDTQRMPAALRPSSRIEAQPYVPPQLGSRSSSKERRRSSISSLTSLLRLSKDSWAKSSSSKSSAPETHESISGSAPPQLGKLRGIETHSRSSSFDTQGSRALDSDHEYLKDIVSFAYQLQASADEPDEVKLEVKRMNGGRLSMPSVQSSPTANKSPINTPPPSRCNEERPRKSKLIGNDLLLNTPPPSRSDEERALMVRSKTKDKQTTQRAVIPKRGSSEDRYSTDQENILKRNAVMKPDIPWSAEPTQQEPAAKDVVSNESNETNQATQATPSSSRPTLSTEARKAVVSSRDGSSYVHKQRMYRQQESIAGYEDELALANASNQTPREKISDIGKDFSPPNLGRSTESVPSDRSPQTQKLVPRNNIVSLPQVNSVPVANNLTKLESSDEDVSAGYHRYLVEQTQKFGNEKGRLGPRLSKAEKILGAKCSDTEGPPSPKRRSRQDPAVSSDATIATPLSNTALRPGAANDKITKEAVDPSLKEAQRASLKLNVALVTAKALGVDNSSGESSVTAGENLSLPTMPRIPATPVLPSAKRLSFEVSSKLTKDVAIESAGSASKDVDSQPSTASDSAEKNEAGHELNSSGVDPNGLVRRTSLKRPRSDPELTASASDTPASVPSFDFLPPLKHQPLSKPKRSSLSRVSFATSPTTIPSTSTNTSSSATSSPSSVPMPSSFPPPSSFPQPFRPPSLPDYSFIGPSGPVTITPVAAGNVVHSGMRAFHPPRSNRSSLMGPPTLPLTSKGKAADEALGTKPLAKMFVICCKCSRWHDLPSKLYEAMALPGNFEGEKATEGVVDAKGVDGGKGKGKEKVEGRVLTSVTCPWCEHGMSTSCCAGWTAIVYLHERHH